MSPNPWRNKIRHHQHCGFTLVEMIAVIVIVGVVGGMLAIFITAPVQGYVDSARRAGINYIAHGALNRVTHDLRTALPNSIRVQGSVSGAGVCNGTETCYLEFIPLRTGGRYLAQTDCASSAVCGGVLIFGTPVTSFEVLGPLPAFAPGDSVVVNNLSATDIASPNNAYNNNAVSNRSAWVSTDVPTRIVTINSNEFPSSSPGNRFHVVATPASYVCAPVSGGTGGTLMRYWGYAIAAVQPTAPGTLVSANPGAVLAGNVAACSFSSLPGNGLVAMQLTLADSGESARLYGVAHVGNVP
jgi:MSHA biogenesis protein MshO